MSATEALAQLRWGRVAVAWVLSFVSGFVLSILVFQALEWVLRSKVVSLDLAGNLLGVAASVVLAVVALAVYRAEPGDLWWHWLVVGVGIHLATLLLNLLVMVLGTPSTPAMAPRFTLLDGLVLVLVTGVSALWGYVAVSRMNYRAALTSTPTTLDQ